MEFYLYDGEFCHDLSKAKGTFWDYAALKFGR